jgi:hypothetical protein
MILKKCIKCGIEFWDNSMFGNLRYCDMCSPKVEYQVKDYWELGE